MWSSAADTAVDQEKTTLLHTHNQWHREQFQAMILSVCRLKFDAHPISQQIVCYPNGGSLFQ